MNSQETLSVERGADSGAAHGYPPSVHCVIDTQYRKPVIASRCNEEAENSCAALNRCDPRPDRYLVVEYVVKADGRDERQPTGE